MYGHDATLTVYSSWKGITHVWHACMIALPQYCIESILQSPLSVSRLYCTPVHDAGHMQGMCDRKSIYCIYSRVTDKKVNKGGYADGGTFTYCNARGPGPNEQLQIYILVYDLGVQRCDRLARARCGSTVCVQSKLHCIPDALCGRHCSSDIDT